MLSSRKIYQASVNAKVHFCITPMVLYECLHKPRSSMTSEKSELIQRLEQARENGGFPVEKCDLDDLVAVARLSPRGIDSGEMSCIATVYGIRTIAFMTDESKARKFAAETLGLTVETTPKLYAWLHYSRHLNDGDHDDVIREHEHYEKKIPLTSFFKDAYKEAMRCRLMLFK
jgi:predicted nucleic acid-binding protein